VVVRREKLRRLGGVARIALGWVHRDGGERSQGRIDVSP
jgi:hypothetical protein